MEEEKERRNGACSIVIRVISDQASGPASASFCVWRIMHLGGDWDPASRLSRPPQSSIRNVFATALRDCASVSPDQISCAASVNHRHTASGLRTYPCADLPSRVRCSATNQRSRADRTSERETILPRIGARYVTVLGAHTICAPGEGAIGRRRRDVMSACAQVIADQCFHGRFQSDGGAVVASSPSPFKTCLQALGPKEYNCRLSRRPVCRQVSTLLRHNDTLLATWSLALARNQACSP